MKKSVNIADRTRNRLFLLAPFLSYIESKSFSVRILSAYDYGDAKTSLGSLRIVPVSSLKELEEAQVQLVSHMKELQNVDKSKLYYPVIPFESAPQYEEIQQEYPLNLVPLARNQTVFKFFTGDLIAAQDLFSYRFETEHDLKGATILISAGPTAEDLDPVRFLTNRSSGKMGIALARAAFTRGANVICVAGPVSISLPAHLTILKVRSAEEMLLTVSDLFDSSHVYIGAAAVADFTPSVKAKEKIKKGMDDLNLPLSRTADILKELQKKRLHQIMVGFSVETNNEINNSQRKLKSKGLDMIVVNNPKVEGAAFSGDTNQVTLLYRDGKQVALPMMTKMELSHHILNELSPLLKRQLK